jgi:hypothetical protein
MSFSSLKRSLKIIWLSLSVSYIAALHVSIIQHKSEGEIWILQMDKMRPEFKAGLDALTKLIFDRARPKQMGSIVMTGPIFAGLTQSFLDAINIGAVPTIATSWQNVEENECRRAHDTAVETYNQSFNKQTPLDEVFLQEVQEEAVQAALTVYNSEAVGGGPTRQKYEKQLHITLKRQFQVNVPEKAVCFCMVFEDVSVGRSTH